MPIVTVTRRLTFNAAHRVYNPALSDEENDAIFGKCNNPNWHGHNYVLEVSVKGEVDQKTGYVMDLGKVKEIVQRDVISHIDHRNIKLEVVFMQGRIPTSENIAVACWGVLHKSLAPARLQRIRLWETENHFVEYHGE
jgi:6-pyruvoyltetrahydropterin/6-carboxytetrahydropterin synthase